MEEKKVEKLKWTNPVLENLSRSKMTRGDCTPGATNTPGSCTGGGTALTNCSDGNAPGGGLINCTSGGIANGCNTGNSAAGCTIGNFPVI